jgi:flagellar motor switch protein FliM
MSTEPVLNQDEVNALLDGMQSGAVSTESAPAPDAVRPFDLVQQARVVRTRMPTLEMMNAVFARRLSSELQPMFRQAAGITASAPRSLRWGEYAESLPRPTSFNRIRVSPLLGTALVVVSADLVSAAVEAFFGGRGRVAKIEGREFTSAENRIVQRMLDSICGSLNATWASEFPAKFEFQSRESSPQFANIVTPVEIVVIVDFTLALEGGSGVVQLVLPYAMIEPIREILGAEVKGDRIDNGEHWQKCLREEISDASVELSTVLGRAELSLAELLNLKPGDVVPCDFGGKATLCAEEIPLLRGGLGVSRGQLAVRIEEKVTRERQLSQTTGI